MSATPESLEAFEDRLKITDAQNSRLLTGLENIAMGIGKNILPESATEVQLREFFPRRPLYLGTGWEFPREFPVGDDAGSALQTGVQLGISQTPNPEIPGANDFGVNVIVFAKTGQEPENPASTFVAVVYSEKISQGDILDAQKIEGILEKAGDVARGAYETDLPILPGYLITSNPEAKRTHLNNLLTHRAKYRAGHRDEKPQT